MYGKLALLLVGSALAGGCTAGAQRAALPADSRPALTAQALPGIPDGWTDGYVFANGIRIHYYHARPAPGKPMIVMCHGITDIGLCWTTLTWKLQDSYDIYMLDARGHGLSDPSTASDNADTPIKDVVEVLRALKIDNPRPILMGHSMGAATVMRLGAQYPDVAKAVIMLDPRLFGTPGSPPAGAPSTAASARGGFSLAMMGDPDVLVAQNNHSYEDLVAIAHRDNPKWDMVDCQYWAISKKQYHGNYVEQRQATSATTSISDALAKITVPALILKADAPPETRRANDEAAKVMQHGKLVHIDGAAHNLHHDQLARTVEVLNEFLTTVK